MNTDELSNLGIPDSKLSRDVTQFIRDTEGDLLFHHSARVFCWGAGEFGQLGASTGPGFDPVGGAGEGAALEGFGIVGHGMKGRQLLIREFEI